jgi:hypothetical protein
MSKGGLTKQQVNAILKLYDGDVPSWLTIKDKNTIIIKATAYEGAAVKFVTITSQDILDYYYYQTHSMSGARGIGTVEGYKIYVVDWRKAESMAYECLKLFSIINPKAVESLIKRQEELKDEQNTKKQIPNRNRGRGRIRRRRRGRKPKPRWRATRVLRGDGL